MGARGSPGPDVSAIDSGAAVRFFDVRRAQLKLVGLAERTLGQRQLYESAGNSSVNYE